MSDDSTPSAFKGDLADKLESVAAHLRGAEPESVNRTIRVTSTLDGAYRATNRVGDHEVVTDQSGAVGGTGSGPSPVDLALAALGSCQAVTYRMWALKLGIDVDDITVTVDAKFDPRGLMGVIDDSTNAPSGIDISVALSGGDSGRYDELRRAVDAHCPVLDLIRTPCDVVTRAQG